MDESKHARAQAGNGAYGYENGSGGRVIELAVGCPCDWLPYAHLHGALFMKISRQRFNLAGPALTREEYEKICEYAR